MSVDILVPVLGRPHRAAPLVQNIRDTTTEDVVITFLSSPSDQATIDAISPIGHASVWESIPVQQCVVDWEPAAGDFGKKINAGFRVTDSEFVFMAADDLTFEPRWDTHALKAMEAGADVVGTNDLANAQVRRGEFGTHCLIRRRYITEHGGTADGTPGPVLWEGYDHNFVDRELCHVAQHRGVFAYARHSHVKHSHPLWRTAPDDPTYRKALRHFRQDQRLFLSRAHMWNHVGLSAPERKMAA